MTQAAPMTGGSRRMVRALVFAFSAIGLTILGFFALVVFVFVFLGLMALLGAFALYRAVFGRRRGRSRSSRNHNDHGDDGLVLDAKPGPHGWSVDSAR